MSETIEHLPIEEGSGQVSEKDLAFLQSSEGVLTLPFGGLDGGPVELHSFDTHRATAAQNMGLKIFNLGEEAAEEFRHTGTYNGIMLDAIIALFLCSRPKQVAKNALTAPNSVRGLAMDWAEKCNINIGNENHAIAMEVFGLIVGGIFAAHAEVNADSEEGEGEGLGES